MKKAHTIHGMGKGIGSATDNMTKLFNEWIAANPKACITMICQPHRWLRWPTGDTDHYATLTFFYEMPNER